ncbi:aldolase/citrate lyase family protein [Sphingomonas sp. MG17]|uniref:Aldolase/citrate lyase family protein n=1 Tax=Sphingomonas tagetis TaxID=2949092 RepID=A0A9X2KMT0_9SPHN|nr:aldolase/citrate lyase family protein [Sphingomonas tagetis]MCP3732130.1 aldolase/citrate lyase family protein [Sphingomonas tagetis]
MKIPHNAFRHALIDGVAQIGLWCTLSSAFTAEVVADAGFDWLLLDTEHSPGDVLTVLGQLQALGGHGSSPVVRPAVNDPVLIKRYLDIGVQSLLIPYVETAEQAQAAVAATRYPPAGIRGVSALTRATAFGRVTDYPDHVERELCLLVQIESRPALDAIEEIASVEGVDGVFIGPGDLAASLGHIGKLNHPDVMHAVESAIERIVEIGKPAGILTGDPAFADRCLALGATFVAVGIDAGILARGADALARRFGREPL